MENFNTKNIIFILLTYFNFFVIIESLPYLQTLPTVDNRYYIIFSREIIFLNSYSNNYDSKHEFVDDQIITNEDESEMTYLKIFKDNPEICLLIVKDYIYGLSVRGNIYCNVKLDVINGHLSVVIPIQTASETISYFVIGLKNSNNKLELHLYRNTIRTSDCSCELLDSKEFNLVSSDNINCYYETSFLCFYENDSNEIVAQYFTVDLNFYNIYSSPTSYSKQNEGAKIIKSIISPDGSKYYICYTKNDNSGDCLIFDLSANQWSEPINYLSDCLLRVSSLNIKFFDSLDYILLSCFQSKTTIQIIKFNNNFEMMDDEQNGVFYLDESLVQNCTEYSLSSLVNDTDQNIIKIFGNCDYTPKKYEIIKFQEEEPTTIPITTYPYSIDENDIVIIQRNSYDTKEEIIQNINNALDDYDLKNIYEIFGNDYKIKISKMNSKIYQNISTYIDFSNCEQLLRAANNLNDSYLLTVFQMEIDNPSNQRLIDDVRYTIFNEEKKILDLSACEGKTIDIYYQLNASMVNMEKVISYANLGIDVFNIEDDFYNDVCYSYSENGADMILKDRISDIYENYSLCENNCKYVGVDLQLNRSTCKCTFASSVDSKTESPTLSEIIRDSFKDSNLAVIVCYKLVFRFQGKFKNIGFWIFTILVFLHFPLFIHYLRFNIFYVKKYIFSEMKKYNYWNGLNSPSKKTGRKKINEKKENNSSKEMKSDKNLVNSKLKKNRNNKEIIKVKNIDKSSSIHSDLSSNIFKKDLIIKNVKNEIKTKKHLAKNIVLLDYKVYNKNYINVDRKKNKSSTFNIKAEKNKNKKINEKEKRKAFILYTLIQMDANNSTNYIPKTSNMILDIYDFNTAIKYDKRNFWRILLICIITKENILNILFFKTPLDIKSLRICLFIFSYSSDLAFNTIFYSNENISDKYHYKGNHLILFTIINNFVQSLISSFVSIAIVNIFQYLIDSRDKFENIFRTEERKMRTNKKYKVSKSTKLKIKEQIKKISFKLKCKIIIYMIIEFILLLFFYYFVTAFCEVYNKTQLSWLLDFIISFFISIAIEIFMSLTIAIFYKLSLKYKLRIIYKIVVFFYNI